MPIFFLLLSLFWGEISFANNRSDEVVSNLYQQAITINETKPNSAMNLFCDLLKESNIPDSMRIDVNLRLAALELREQNYSSAFDYVSTALQKAETINDTLGSISARIEFGNLYKDLQQEKQSAHYLHSAMDLCHEFEHFREIPLAEKLKLHYSFGMHYRVFKKYNLALAHLDTCDVLCEKIKYKPVYNSYHQVERASILFLQNHDHAALNSLLEVQLIIEAELENKYVPTRTKGYLTIVCYMIGLIYEKKERTDFAISYFSKSIEYHKKYEFHKNTARFAYEKLANLNSRNKEYQKAYSNLLSSLQVTNEFYNKVSPKNSNLIQIHNRYQKQLEKQKIEILKQKGQITNQQKNLYLLQCIVLFIISLVIVGFLIIQKRKLGKKHQLEQKKTQQTIDTKNRELTTSALQLIEKDELLALIAKELETESGKHQQTISLINSLLHRSDSMWEEFNRHFVDVHSDFYLELDRKFPGMSFTEKKHCALIRLNLSGKDMAHLLGISVTSVHVSRYRLRKKFGLEKGESLSKFLASF